MKISECKQWGAMVAQATPLLLSVANVSAPKHFDCASLMLNCVGVPTDSVQNAADDCTEWRPEYSNAAVKKRDAHAAEFAIDNVERMYISLWVASRGNRPPTSFDWSRRKLGGTTVAR